VGSAKKGDGALKVSLLGPTEVLVDGRPLQRVYSRRGLWLFALLALRPGKEVDRAWLAATLWPDAKEATGLFYLRRELLSLRKALGDEAYRLNSPGNRVLRLDLSGAEFDLEAFDRAAADQDEHALQTAISLYRGPLLEGCNEEWATSERQSRELAYTGALESVAQIASARSDLQAAIPILRRLVTSDPLRESAHRNLIRALAMNGDVAAARKAFRDLRIMLFRELGVEPAPETLEVVSQIRADLKQKSNRLIQKLEATNSRAPGSVPQPLTSLIGRTRERGAIFEMLEASRLVTLLGTGGVGKTRLALDVAESLKGNFTDGAWFVDLAPISDAKLLGTSIAAVFNIREVPGRSIEQVLYDKLRTRQLLIVLDNCEQVIVGAAGIAQRLLQNCPGLKVLATSRQSLGVTGEGVFRVPSLDTPPEPSRTPVPTDYDSVRLFVERAGQASRGFALSAKNEDDVGRICRTLGGIPLAIELAAARVGTMSVDEIAKRLDNRFALLSGGVRGGVPRQQTLRASVDWSYELLCEEEQGLFRRLSVFAGGFKLEQVEAICEGGQQMLSELVDKSLVLFDDWIARYSLLETMRQYSTDRLAESGETQTYRDRHLGYFLALAEEAEPHLIGPDQHFWLDRLEEEHDNVRFALQWCRDVSKDYELGLRLAAAVSKFWTIRGYNGEGRDWLTELLGKSPEKQDLQIRGNALSAAGLLGTDQGDGTAAEACIDESIAIRKKLGDNRGIADCLNHKANLAFFRGDYAAEQACREEGLAIWRELDDDWGIAMSLGNLGWTAYTVGDFASSSALQNESLAIRRKLGLQRGIANSLHGLGVTAHALGDLAAARPLLQESLAIQREVGWTRGTGSTLRALGQLSFDEGDLVAARSNLAESLPTCWEVGDRFIIAGCLELAAQIAAAEADVMRAARIWGASEELREENGSAMPPNDRARFERNVASARSALKDDSSFDKAWKDGRGLSTEQAIALALQ
jgi:predicted ATPase/DNA-binding SARP family transcriptional activator